MPILQDVVKRVQRLLDDPKGTWAKDQAVIDFAQNEYEAIFNALPLSLQNAEERVELPNVAPIPSLDDFMNPGTANPALINLVIPRYLEYKLPGQDPSLYRLADGPIDEVRDLAAGVPAIDSWSWVRRSLKLSRFSVNLDLRVTGDFMFDPLVDANSQIQVAINLTPVLVYRIAAIMAISHTQNQTWLKAYPTMATDAFDDFLIQLVKQNQGKTRRVGSMGRANFPFGTTYLNR